MVRDIGDYQSMSPGPCQQLSTLSAGRVHLPEQEQALSQPLIIGAVSLAVIDTAVSDLRKSTGAKAPQFKIIIGGFVVVVVLLALSDSQEELADSIAIVILLATLFGPNAGALATLITKLTGGKYDPTAVGQDVISAAQRGADKASQTHTQN